MLWIPIALACALNPAPLAVSTEAPSEHAIEVAAGAIVTAPLSWSAAGVPRYQAAPGVHLLAGYSPIRYLAFGLELSVWPDRSWTTSGFGDAVLPLSVGVFAEGRLPILPDLLSVGLFVRGGLFGYVRSGLLVRLTPAGGFLIALDVGWEYLHYAGSENSLAVALLVGWRFGGL